MEDNKNTQVDDTQKSTNNEGKAEGKTFTQDDLDKIVKERLHEVKSRLEKEFSNKLENEKAEAERLAKLSVEEKEKELVAKQKQEIEQERRELALSRNELTAVKVLANEGIPQEFVSYILDVDAEKQEEKTKLFIEKYKKAIQDGVSKQLEGKQPPKDLNTNSNVGVKKPIQVI